MTVYIDVLVILNFYITYFTLKAAASLTHSEYSFARLIAASVLGGIGSLLSLADTGLMLSLILKAALIAATAAAAFGAGRGLFIKTLLCVLISAAICGAAELIHGIIGTDLVFSVGGSVYMNISALVLVAATAAAYGAMTLLRRFFDSSDSDERVTLTVENGGRQVSLSALPDSGNSLRDFLSGTPVVVCRADKLKSVAPESLTLFLDGMSKNGSLSVDGLRLIPIRTASGTGLIAAFRPDAVTARFRGCEKRLSVLVGTNADSLKNESFDAIINPKLLH